MGKYPCIKYGYCRIVYDRTSVLHGHFVTIIHGHFVTIILIYKNIFFKYRNNIGKPTILTFFILIY